MCGGLAIVLALYSDRKMQSVFSGVHLSGLSGRPGGHQRNVLHRTLGTVFVAAVLASAAFAAACDRRDDEVPPVPANAQTVRVDGSSTVYLISNAVGDEVFKQGVKVSVKE